MPTCSGAGTIFGLRTQLIFCLIMFGEVDMFAHDILSVLRYGSATPTARPKHVYENKMCVLGFDVTRNNTKTIIYRRKIFNETSSKRFLHASCNEKACKLQIRVVLSPFCNQIICHLSTLSKRKSNSETAGTGENVLFRWLRFGLLFCVTLQNQ